MFYVVFVFLFVFVFCIILFYFIFLLVVVTVFCGRHAQKRRPNSTHASESRVTPHFYVPFILFLFSSNAQSDRSAGTGCSKGAGGFPMRSQGVCTGDPEGGVHFPFPRHLVAPSGNPAISALGCGLFTLPSYLSYIAPTDQIDHGSR